MLVSRGATMVKHERFTVLSLSLFILLGLNISTAQAQTFRYVNRTDPTCNGNKAMAARMLKIKRTTLVAKLHSRSTRKEDDEYPIIRITN